MEQAVGPLSSSLQPPRSSLTSSAARARPPQDTATSIGISKQRWKQIEAILLVREQRENRNQELAFHARPFVLCGLPLRRLPHGQLTYMRRNGKFFLQIVGHPDFGLPFGQDRLIPIWIATLALRQKSRVVRFDSAAQLLDFFRLAKDGFHYRRLVDGFQRVFAATMFFGTENNPGGNSILDWARFHFFDHIHLWFTAGWPRHPEAPEMGNTVTLSPAFYEEIDKHRIPVEREVVAALAHAPGILDFYVWLVWKTWTLNRDSARIPILGTSGLAAQLGAAPYSLPRRFRHLIGEWLSRVKAYWPECPAELSLDRHYLVVRSSKASPALKPAQNSM